MLAAGPWGALESLSEAADIGKRLAGFWMGSIEEVGIALEIAAGGQVSATLTSPEPVFYGGTFTPAPDDKNVVNLTLEAPEGRWTARCALRDQSKLVLTFEDGSTSECTRKATFNWSTWGTYYYLRPRPERFVEAVEAMTGEGILDKDFVNVADVTILLSQVLHQNPSQIKSWIGQINRKGRERLWNTVLWYSRTAEAAQIMMDDSGKKGRRWSQYYESGSQVVTQIDPTEPPMLDMNWGYFMATGDTTAVRNIIRAFNYGEFESAIDAWESSQKTPSDRERFAKGMAFRAAKWSVGANCARHSRVLAYCDQLLKSGDLTNQERATLAEAMSSVDVQMARARFAVDVSSKSD